MLKALKFIHSASVIHRDIKPGNILINSECFVKIADFGLARCITSEKLSSDTLTDYVATRWYRAPEVLLGAKFYTTAMDIWSIGCIVAEMYLGKPMFQGTSVADQLIKIFEVVGSPTAEQVSGWYGIKA